MLRYVKWQRKIGGGFKEGLTEWGQFIADEVVDKVGYDQSKDILDALFSNEAAQNFWGGVIGGGAVRTPGALTNLSILTGDYVSPDAKQSAAEAQKYINQNIREGSTSRSNRKGAISRAKDQLSGVLQKKSQERDELNAKINEAKEEKERESLPDIVKDDSDYMNYLLGSWKHIIKIDEEGLIERGTTDESTAKYIEKKKGAPPSEKLLDLYTK